MINLLQIYTSYHHNNIIIIGLVQYPNGRMNNTPYFQRTSPMRHNGIHGQKLVGPRPSGSVLTLGPGHTRTNTKFENLGPISGGPWIPGGTLIEP